MARIGLYPALIVVVFGIVAPFFIFRFGRLIEIRASPRFGFRPWSWLRGGESGISLGCERIHGKCRLHGGKRLHPRRLCRRQLQRRRLDRQNDFGSPSRVSHPLQDSVELSIAILAQAGNSEQIALRSARIVAALTERG